MSLSIGTKIIKVTAPCLFFSKKHSYVCAMNSTFFPIATCCCCCLRPVYRSGCNAILAK